MSTEATTRPPGFPARPVLRPGVRVCRRSATELQVGLAPDLALVLPDEPGVRGVLDGLADGRAPQTALLTPAAALACERLLARGLVVDADLWCTALDGLDGDAASARSALVAEAGDAAGLRLNARHTVRVGITDDGLPRAADALLAVLTTAGVAVTSPQQADVVAVLRGAEPDRSELDGLVRADRAHVLLTVSEGRVHVGPFVQPGVTACQRCIDATLAETDPRRSLVLEQYAAPATPVWGLPVPIPADLVDLAVALLARDLTRWADLLEPATWSTTIGVDPALTFPRRRWRRHAACGCSGNAAAALPAMPEAGTR